jgi:hypothetical protein
MTTDEFCELHLRLILDRRTAFRGDGTAAGVRRTSAGIAWLNDHATYRTAWLALEKSGTDVQNMLRYRFGFIPDHEISTTDAEIS